MPITSRRSDQIFQIVSRKESTPWTNRSVALEKNYEEKEQKDVGLVCLIFTRWFYTILLTEGMILFLIKPSNGQHSYS